MQDLTDWSKWEFYHYLIAAGIVVVILALILYFIPGFRIKMPAIVIAGLGCLAAGLGIGMVVMAALGYQLEPVHRSGEGPPPSMEAMMKGGDMKGPGGGRRGQGGMAPMGGFGKAGGRSPGGGGPSPKTQLATLVDKLDVLTGKPLAIELTPERRAKVAELLKGLDDKTELTDEDAKQK